MNKSDAEAIEMEDKFLDLVDAIDDFVSTLRYSITPVWADCYGPEETTIDGRTFVSACETLEKRIKEIKD